MGPWFIAAADASDRLADPVRPIAQRVEIAIDPAQEETHGRTVLTVELTESAAGFSLHAEELVLGEVTLGIPGKKARPATATLGEHGALRIDARKPLKPGTWELTIPFTGRIQSRTYGLYRFDVDGVPYVASSFWPDDARTAWPCFDEPALKIPVDLVVTAPAGQQVVANTPIESQVAGPDGVVTTFVRTEPLPSYLLAVLVGPYEPHPVAGAQATVWTVHGHDAFATGIAADLAPALDALETWFGSSQPYPKADWIVVPEFPAAASENPGVIVAAETFVPPLDRATPASAEFRTHVVVHELSHLWFGDSVTMAWWDDFWLSESFAEWLSLKIAPQLHPEYRGEVSRVERLEQTIRADGLSSARPMRVTVDPNAVAQTLNLAVYPKGEAVLDMVEAWLGPDSFRRGLRLYIDRHAGGSATAPDLLAALAEASGKGVPAVLGAFLDTPGVPLVSLELDDTTLRVTQRPFSLVGSAPPAGGPWRIPLRMRIGRADGTSEVVTAVVEGRDDVEVGDARWILPTADGLGYYAWSMPEDQIDPLLAAVPSLSAPERRSVLAMLSLQHDAGIRSLADLQARLAVFDRDSDPALLDAVRETVLQVRVLAENIGDPALEAAAQAFVRARLGPMLAGVGREPVAGEPLARSTLRVRLLDALAHAGAPDVRAYGVTLARAVVADPKSVSPALAEFALVALAESGAPGIQAELFARADREPDPTVRQMFLNAAGRVPGPEALTKAVERGYAPDTPPADQEALLVGVGSRAREDERDRILELTMTHFDTLMTTVPPVLQWTLATYGGGCSLARAERARAFFGDPAHTVVGAEQALADTEARTRACIRRIEADGESLRALLHRR